jgi:hypothetical protein
MSLVHNYGTWMGLRSRDTGFDGDADTGSRGRGTWHQEPLKMRGREGKGGTLAPARERGVKFSRPSFTQRFANLALCL